MRGRASRPRRHVEKVDVSDEQKKVAIYCPVCGAKRWTLKQMENHIKKKHKEK